MVFHPPIDSSFWIGRFLFASSKYRFLLKARPGHFWRGSFHWIFRVVYILLINTTLVHLHITIYLNEVCLNCGFVPCLLQRLHFSLQSVHIVVIFVITFSITTSGVGPIAPRSMWVSVENCPIKACLSWVVGRGHSSIICRACRRQAGVRRCWKRRGSITWGRWRHHWDAQGVIIVHSTSFCLLEDVLGVVHGHHARMGYKVWKSTIIVAVLLTGRLSVGDQVHVGVLVVV